MFFEGSNTYRDYAGDLYHSETEAAWAAYWDSLDVPYVHWPVTCEFPDGGRWYTPDFYLPDTDLIVEVKNGNVGDDDAFRLRYLGYLTNTACVLFDGKPRNVAAYFYSPTSSIVSAYTNQHYADIQVANRRWLMNIGEKFPHTKDAMWSPESMFSAPSSDVMQQAKDYLADLHRSRAKLIARH